MLELATALAGGLGAATRYLVDGAVKRRVRPSRPVAIIGINIVGSLLLGVLAGAVARGRLAPAWQLVAGTGFCGGFTTFSTAMLDVVLLAAARRRVAAAGVLLFTASACVLAAALGLTLG